MAKSNTLLKYGVPFLVFCNHDDDDNCLCQIIKTFFFSFCFKQSFMVLGSFLLREFTSIRYEVYNYRRRYVVSFFCFIESCYPFFLNCFTNNSISQLFLLFKIQGTKRRDLDYVDDDEKSDEVTTTTAAANNDNENLKELIELGRNDEWKNVRGPRPWEDNREYKEMVDKVVNKKTTATATKSI